LLIDASEPVDVGHSTNNFLLVELDLGDNLLATFLDCIQAVYPFEFTGCRNIQGAVEFVGDPGLDSILWFKGQRSRSWLRLNGGCS
jgi:hypothetical protein